MGIRIQGLELLDPEGVGGKIDLERLLHGMKFDARSMVERATARSYQPPEGVLMAEPRSLPFGGKFRGGAMRRAGEGILLAQDSRIPPNSGHGGFCDDIQKLAGTCKPWGARPPENCCDRRGYLRPDMVCGAVLPYRATVTAGATAQAYNLKAEVWAQPFYWIDSSHTDITITSLKYATRTVWGTNDVAVNPLASFGASNAERRVPGLPAFGANDGESLKHELANANAADQDYAGIFIGVAAMV